MTASHGSVLVLVYTWSQTGHPGTAKEVYIKTGLVFNYEISPLRRTGCYSGGGRHM